MAQARFKVNALTGSSGATITDTARSTNFLSADTVDSNAANYPVAIPGLVSDPANYSMERVLEIECTTAPDNYTEAFKVWGPNKQPDYDQSPGNKLTINMGTTATAITATSSASSVATTRQDTNYYSSGTGLAIPVIPGDSKINAIGEKTQRIALQLKVDSGANSGPIPLQLFSIGWTEL